MYLLVHPTGWGGQWAELCLYVGIILRRAYAYGLDLICHRLGLAHAVTLATRVKTGEPSPGSLDGPYQVPSAIVRYPMRNGLTFTLLRVDRIITTRDGLLMRQEP